MERLEPAPKRDHRAAEHRAPTLAYEHLQNPRAGNIFDQCEIDDSHVPSVVHVTVDVNVVRPDSQPHLDGVAKTDRRLEPGMQPDPEQT